MAKGARASTVKRNNANLRAKIFGPAVDERTARLSAKLQELVAKPRPDQERAMNVDEQNAENQLESIANIEDAMDVDTKDTSTKRKPSTKKKHAKIEKMMIKKKPKNQIIFPSSAAKRKRIAQSKRKSV